MKQCGTCKHWLPGCRNVWWSQVTPPFRLGPNVTIAQLRGPEDAGVCGVIETDVDVRRHLATIPMRAGDETLLETHATFGCAKWEAGE